MFHRNDEQIFVVFDLPCVLSVGKMLLLLIVDHRDIVTVGRDEVGGLDWREITAD
jgi:hypothetical protein